MMTHTPIHTGTVNGRRVRFFPAPLRESETPWAAASDLLRALGYSPDQASMILQGSNLFETRQIMTASGPVAVFDGKTVEKAIHSLAGWGVAGEATLAEFVAAEEAARNVMLDLHSC